MQRPEVRLIQDQQIEINDNPNIDGWEAEQLLRKYGYQNEQPYNIPEQPVNNLTFEEMVTQEDTKKRNEEVRKKQMSNGQQPISFDGRGGYYTETKYGSDEDSGY